MTAVFPVILAIVSPKTTPLFNETTPKTPPWWVRFPKRTHLQTGPANDISICKLTRYTKICLPKTVGSFRRNTYIIGPRVSCRLVRHGTKRDGGSPREGGSPSKIGTHLVPSAFFLLLFCMPRPYPFQRAESSKIINLRYTFIRRTLHSLNSLAVNFLTVRSSSFWYNIAQLVLSATS